MDRSGVQNALVFVLALATLVFGYSYYVLSKVRQSIGEVVGDQPYCVQVSTRGGYRSLTTSLQLAGFYLHGTGGRFHAVLVVGNPESPVFYHWSYFNSEFVEHSSSNAVRLFCEPQLRFLEDVDEGKVRTAHALESWRYGYRISVPDAYSPSADTSDWALFAMLARAPRFEPGGSYRCPTAPCSYVGVSVASDTKLEMWRRRQSVDDRIESLGMEEGLIKERVWPTGKRAGKEPSLQYYAMDANGRTTTLILCFQGSQYQCTHLFTDGELSYYFHHMPSELYRWREMHEHLEAKVAPFIVHGPPSK
jgi:hypothetical protein